MLRDRRHAAALILAATSRGAVFTAESYEQTEDTWWFLGDDFRDVRKRDLIAEYFDLRGVIFRGVDLEAPLGLSDVRFVPHYTIEPASCLDEHGGLELGTLKGLDVVSLAKAFRAAVEDLRLRLRPDGRLDALELQVGFAGVPPKLPRPKLLVGRWRANRGFEGWAGSIARGGVTTKRDVVLPPELRDSDFEIVIYRVGDIFMELGNARAPKHEYKPWGAGAYWALACHPEECFVLAAVRQL
jgi:hypothetical protein